MITTEEKEALFREWTQRQEAAKKQERESRNVWNNVKREIPQIAGVKQYQFETALATLSKAAFGVRGTANLPMDKEPEIADFVKTLCKVVTQTRQNHAETRTIQPPLNSN